MDATGSKGLPMARGVRRRGIFYIGLPLATLLLGVVAVRADVPNLFKDGDPLSAATMNANFKDLDTRLGALSSKVTALESTTTELTGKVAALEQAKVALEAELAQVKGGQADPLCPAGYTHDSNETGFVRCTRGTPVFDEVVRVESGAIAFWMDRFEASVWQNADGTGNTYGLGPSDYPIKDNAQDATPIYALSKPGVSSSRHITWYQAQAACAHSGKRLPSGDEWLRAARGTVDPGASNGANGLCVTQAGAPRLSGLGTNCRSKWGAEDMIGNVWEMTQEWFFTLGLENPVTDQGQNIPGLAMYGLALQEVPLPAGYNDDAVWGIASGGYITGSSLKHPRTPNMALRGGSFQAGLRAGIFSLAVDSSVGARMHYSGFRCMIPHRSG